MISTQRLLLALLSALTLLACHADPYGSDPDSAYALFGECEQPVYACTDEWEACLDRNQEVCLACYRLPFYVGCAYECDYVPQCRASHCRATDRCDSWNYTARLGDQDPAIREACERARARDTQCGVAAHPDGACELFAATEVPEAAAIYDCIASSPCGAEAACDEPEPDTDLAGRTCGAITACDWQWESCQSESWPAWLGWLRHDVKRALEQCLDTVECEQRLTCVEAWLNSLDPTYVEED